MDVFGLLGYINKFSLLAFIVTLGVLVYQVYQLKKDSKSTNETPVIPDFNENASVPSLNYSPLNTKVEAAPSKNLNLNLIILIVLTVGIIIFLFFSIFMKGNNSGNANQKEKEQPLIKLAASKGIKVYDGDWSELDENGIASLKGGDAVIVGIERTSDLNIDKARIRLNKPAWDEGDENLTFDKTMNIFYKKFTIATDSAFLKIEAQLHHSKDGWLGE